MTDHDELDEIVSELYEDEIFAAEGFEARAARFLQWWERSQWHSAWRPIRHDGAVLAPFWGGALTGREDDGER